MAANEYRGFKGTKFVVTVLTIVLSAIALFVGKLSGELWVAGAVGLAVNYVVGDVRARQIEKTGQTT